MGAEQFLTIGVGSTVIEAFRHASESAAYDHGHAGYTGTIAEKPGGILFPLPKDLGPISLYDILATYLQSERDVKLAQYVPDANERQRMYEAFDNKWDECLAVQVEPGRFAFMGWASC